MFCNSRGGGISGLRFLSNAPALAFLFRLINFKRKNNSKAASLFKFPPDVKESAGFNPTLKLRLFWNTQREAGMWFEAGMLIMRNSFYLKNH